MIGHRSRAEKIGRVAHFDISGINMTVELQSGNRFPHVVTRQCDGVFRLLDPPIQGHPRDSMRTLMGHRHMHVGNTLLGTNSDVKLNMF